MRLAVSKVSIDIFASIASYLDINLKLREDLKYEFDTEN